jgi:glutamate-5-semialdehyde dehydrogenase
MDVASYIHTVGRQARAAARVIARADTATKNRALKEMAAALERSRRQLLEANALDVAEAKRQQLEVAMIDRLTLSAKVIASMADGLRQIAALPDPIGEMSPSRKRPSGIRIAQMRVPIGVVAIIYESRPATPRYSVAARRRSTRTRRSPPACMRDCAPPACRRPWCRSSRPPTARPSAS